MGNTATDDEPAMAAGTGGNNGETGNVKNAAARKSAARENATGKKPASRNRQAKETGAEKSGKKSAGARNQSAGKARRNAPSAALETARPEGVAQHSDVQQADADSAAAVTATANTTDKANQDSRSISWMSAQAVSALNAVKASQARKAEALLARVEKPVPGRPGITELPEQTGEDLLEEIPDTGVAAMAVPETVEPQETKTTSPAAAGETPTNQKETTVMQDKPGEPQTTTAEAGNTTDHAATETQAPEAGSAGADTTASPETVVAAQVQQTRGLPARPVVMVVFLAMLAFAGYRYWKENHDSFLAVQPVADEYSETIQDATWEDIPQQEAISVVGTTTGEPPAPADTAPDAAVQSDTPATGELATPVAEPHTPAAVDSGVAVVQPVTDAGPPPAAQAETPASPETVELPVSEQPETEEITTSKPPESGETTASEPPPQAATVVAPSPAPSQPQPRYGAPGYYYPQQPNWQQPYYRPAYPPQYPAR
jgi:hypothetical protein